MPQTARPTALPPKINAPSGVTRPVAPPAAKVHRTLSLSSTGSAGHRLTGLLPARQLPVRPDEVAGVAVRVVLQIILMLGLGLPERSDRRKLGDNLSRPKTGRIDVCNGIFRDP